MKIYITHCTLCKPLNNLSASLSITYIYLNFIQFICHFYPIWRDTTPIF